MDVSTKPNVVGKVPTDMVGVIVNDDVVTIPQPVAAVADIERRDAEVEAAEPETTGSSTRQMPAMTRAETSGEVAVFPGMVEMKAGVIASLIVADPLAVPVNMRCLGMALLITK